MIEQVENPIVEVHQLTVCYGKKPVLWNVDCSFEKGNIIGIIGPNGAGKSTLLKTIVGIIAPESGFVKIYGNPIAKNRKKISYIPQKESIDWSFPVSVLDVVLMGRYGKRGLFKKLTKEDYEIAHEALNTVAMQDYYKVQLSELSGGQQQRVFIARALSQEAEIYFFDEPFSGIDAMTEEAMIQLFKKMGNEGKTIFIVHHDLQSAYNYFDWIVMLNSSLVASGRKKNVYKADLIQKTYGGKLTTLEELKHLIEIKSFPIREQ